MAFNWNASLKEVILNEGIESIGYSAFSGCTALNGMFANTSDDLVITLPKDPMAQVKPIREQYASESDIMLNMMNMSCIGVTMQNY